MNKYFPNSYDAYFGWRGVDIILTTQTEGASTYAAGISAKNPTDIVVQCGVTFANKFISLKGNYMLVHQYLITSGAIIGKEFYIPTACTGVTVAPAAVPNCNESFAYSVPPGYNRLISLRQLTIYRDVDLSRKVDFDLSLEVVDASNIKIRLSSGELGQVKDYYVQLILISTKLFDTNAKRTFQLDLFENLQPVTTNVLTTTVFPLACSGFDTNLFVALKHVQTLDSQIHYSVEAGTDLKIRGLTYLTDAYPHYRGIVFYGYICTIVGYYFSDDSQSCEVCPQNCINCKLNIVNQPQCLSCKANFVVSADKLSCQCPLTQASTVCDNLGVLGLADCTNAIRNTNFQCLFCSGLKFQVVQNNQCVCKNGFNDLDGDGTCEQICGDGIFFLQQCDDGNTNSNDGCRSDCVREPGYTCDQNQPTFCTYNKPISYKIAFTQKIEGKNKAIITLQLINSLSSLPFDISASEFRPPTTYVRLFLILSEAPLKQVEITDTNVLELSSEKEMSLEFSYNFTIEKLKARIFVDYSKTRYLSHVQELKFDLQGVNSPLVYSDNLATYATISIVLCVGTAFSLIGLLVGLCSPKFIGLEYLLSLQLIFFSQLLISDPVKWPVGFMYLKYLKFSTGYNDILKLTDYVPYTDDANKMKHLDMKKSIIQNFNFNFVILAISFIVFITIYILKYIKETQLLQQQQKRKAQSLLEQNNSLAKVDQSHTHSLLNSYIKLSQIVDKVFWVVNHFCVWMILPLMASISARIEINGSLVQKLGSGLFFDEMLKLGATIGLVSVFIIFTICLNNFFNIFLSRDTMKKILFKPEEQVYKRMLFIYLLIVGFFLLFLNHVIIIIIPMSMLVLVIQVIYTIALIVIHPYKQSLRVHTIVLLINQCVYIVFLLFINYVNLAKQVDENLVVILGYFITGCCGILMVLTAVRLYYQLRYGEALEKEIQKERELEEKRLKKQQEERLERKRRKLESQAKKKQTQQEIQRERNNYLFENQIKQDEAKDVMQWLQKYDWEVEDKEKYFFSKFSQKPLEWLKQNNPHEYEQAIDMKKQLQETRRQRTRQKVKNDDYIKLTGEMRKQGQKHIQILQRKLLKHQTRIQQDMNYSMNVKKKDMDKFVSLDYTLAD